MNTKKKNKDLLNITGNQEVLYAFMKTLKSLEVGGSKATKSEIKKDVEVGSTGMKRLELLIDAISSVFCKEEKEKKADCGAKIKALGNEKIFSETYKSGSDADMASSLFTQIKNNIKSAEKLKTQQKSAIENFGKIVKHTFEFNSGLQIDDDLPEPVSEESVDDSDDYETEFEIIYLDDEAYKLFLANYPTEFDECIEALEEEYEKEFATTDTEFTPKQVQSRRTALDKKTEIKKSLDDIKEEISKTEKDPLVINAKAKKILSKAGVLRAEIYNELKNYGAKLDVVLGPNTVAALKEIAGS